MALTSSVDSNTNKKINENASAAKVSKEKKKDLRITYLISQDDYAKKCEVDSCSKNDDGAMVVNIERQRTDASFSRAIRHSASTPSVHKYNLRTSPSISKKGYTYGSRQPKAVQTKILVKKKNVLKKYHFTVEAWSDTNETGERRVSAAGQSNAEKMHFVMAKRKRILII